MIDEYSVHHFQDCWSILYLHLARSITDRFHQDGEMLLREAVRRYGKDRGQALRKKHDQDGLKPNLYSMFHFYDLPVNTQYRQNKVVSDEQERITHTRACPIADLWKEHGALALGRVYCEEFHHAIYGTYNPHTQINLAQTLTMDGYDFCCFATYLRPGNMSAEERKATFSEFDPDYQIPEGYGKDAEGHEKEQFNMLMVKLYDHMAKVALEADPKTGEQALIVGLTQASQHILRYLRQRAAEFNRPWNRLYLIENFPMETNISSEAYWADPDKREQSALLQRYFLEGLTSTLEPNASDCSAHTTLEPNASDCSAHTASEPNASDCSAHTASEPDASDCSAHTTLGPDALDCSAADHAAHFHSKPEKQQDHQQKEDTANETT